MLSVRPFDRLVVARRALAEASHAVGLPLARSEERGEAIATGLAALDAALGGGLPRGRLVEIVGERSSGRLSLTLALLSRAMRTGEPVALIDPVDALDPRALSPGDRSQLLWIRPSDVFTALRCADLLLDAGGFAMVAMYLVGVASVRARNAVRTELHAVRETATVTERRGIHPSAWARLARRAERARSAMLVVLDPRSSYAPGVFAYASLQVRRHRAVWCEHAPLEAVEGEIAVTRSKLGAEGTSRVVFRATE